MSYEVKDFDRDVLQRSRTVPVVVDFWAPWCGPCKMLGPVLEKLASEAGGRWELVKVDTDQHPGLAEAFNISSIPSVKLFRDASVVDQFLGLMPEPDIRRWLNGHLPSPADEQLHKAAELIDDGNLAGARELLEQALAADPHRAAAKLLLAEILLSDDPVKACAVIDEIPLDAEEAGHATALKVLAETAQRTSESLPEDELKPVIIDGLEAIRQRNWDAALAAFTLAIERKQGYADGLARNAGKAIFRYLGVRHPTAEKYFRRFSSAVNA
jgi:putative thioredoxin